MSRARRDAFAITASLTFAFGVLGHLVVEIAGQNGRLDLYTPAHGVMSAVALLALWWSLGRLAGARSGAERRRRIALVRTAVGADSPAFFAAVTVAQATIAVAILGLEGFSLAPHALLAAIVSLIIGVLAGTFALRLARRRLVAVLCSWTGPSLSSRRLSCALRNAQPPRTCAAIPFLRSRPDRAPPQLALAA